MSEKAGKPSRRDALRVPAPFEDAVRAALQVKPHEKPKKKQRRKNAKPQG